MPKATWFDRALAVVAPKLALSRVRARAAFEVTARAYEGAAGGRPGANWAAAGTAADAEVHGNASYLRNRMRDLVRNNPHAASAVSVLATYIVGDGITARSDDPKVMALWNEFRRKCDADGQLTFEGLQTLICREMIEGGEALVRRRVRRKTDPLPVPMQIQVIEADLLDMARVGPMQDNDTFAIQGVEHDKLGRRVNYWLFPAHPGNNYLMYKVTLLSVRVPAADVIHVYEKQRTQVRGVPWGAPVVMNLRDLDDYEDSEITRKKIEACAVGVVTGGDETDMGVGIPAGDDEIAALGGVYDSSGATVDRFEPGMFLYARGGKQITFNSPAATGSYEAYKRASLQTIAAGFRVPYELLTGDLSHVSFISGRLGLQKFYRLVSQVQKQIIIPTVCQRIWDWFIEAAILAGKLPDGDYPVEWTTPPMPIVDLLNEVQADIAAVRAGFLSMQSVIAKYGRDPHVVLAEIKAFIATADAAGMIFDTDPRVVAKTGVFQPVPTSTETEGQKAGAAK